MALKRLQAEFKQLTVEPNYFYTVEPDPKNFYLWNVLLIGPPDSPFEGGIFKFVTNLFHPNIYKDGKVCISILHDGKDEWGYEDISERWNPSHSVNSVLMSVLSMLSNPNFESPANVDASVMWRNDWESYKKQVYKTVSQSH